MPDKTGRDAQKAPDRRIARNDVLLAGMGVFLAVLVCACSRAGSKGEQGSTAPKYPAELSAESSPSAVAQVLIRALEEEDTPTLMGLVAVKAESKAVEDIYRRHGREAKTDYNKVARFTAGGWAISYAFVQNGSAEVGKESVQGDKATVTAGARLPNGDPCRLRLKLVQEDGVWKVGAGIEMGKE